MSKLNFNNPLEGNALFADQPQEQPKTPVKKKMGRPRRDDIVRESGAQEGLREDSVRYTVIFQKNTMQFLRDYAFTKRITIKEALRLMIEKFEADYYADPNNEKLISKDGDE